MVNLISLVVPGTHQRPSALIKSLSALGVALLPGLQGDLHHGVFGQLQWLKRPEFPTLINGTDRNRYPHTIPTISLRSKAFSSTTGTTAPETP